MYYQKVKLNCFEQIKSFGLGSVDTNSTEYKILNIKFDNILRKVIEDEVSELYNEKKTFSECLLFLTPAGVKQEIHLDGNSLESLGKFRTALNIPLMNCDTSPMIWYRGEFKSDMVEYQGTKNIKIDWIKGPFELARTYIDSPTLVRVDVPHHVYNPTTKSRIILSVRFKPKLTFI